MEEYGSLRWSKNVSIQLDELTEMIEKLQQNIGQGGGEIPSSITTTLNTLSTSVGNLQTAVSNLQTDVNTETGLINTIISNYNTLQSAVSTLSGDLNTLSSSHSTLQSTVSSINTDLSTLTSTASQLGTSLTSLQSAVTQNTSDIALLQTSDEAQDDSIEKLEQDDISNREIRNVDEVFDISTVCEIEARLTSDTLYPIDAFRAKQGWLTKLHVMFCARAYASGEYGSARLDFYIDNVLINSTTVTCQDDDEHIYEFDYNFFPNGNRQEIKMEMIHLSLTESNKNVRICVQFVKMRLRGYNCFFYEQINSPVSIDFDNTTSYYTGSNPCLTFGNLSRYARLWEIDCVTKVERDWNTGIGGSLRNLSVPQSSLFRSKKMSVSNIFNIYAMKKQQLGICSFMTASNAVVFFSANYNSSGVLSISTLYQNSNVYATIANVLQINNQLPYYDTYSSLYQTYHDGNRTMYDAVVLYKDANTGDWKACLTFNKNTFQQTKLAIVTMPNTVGTIADIFACYRLYDADNPYFCLFFITNDQDEIYLYDFEPDSTKMENPFLDDFLVAHSSGYFPLYIDKGINPFGYNEGGKMHIFYSSQNRIYKKVYDYQSNTLSKRQYVCDGQYYFEGPGGYHIRNQGVMSHVFKSDLLQ